MPRQDWWRAFWRPDDIDRALDGQMEAFDRQMEAFDRQMAQQAEAMDREMERLDQAMARIDCEADARFARSMLRVSVRPRAQPHPVSQEEEHAAEEAVPSPEPPPPKKSLWDHLAEGADEPAPALPSPSREPRGFWAKLRDLI